MTLQQIYYCLNIADTGSMNRAAEKLYLSQPTLTSSIHELENELGIRIFERSSRGVALTREGRKFLAEARQLYQQYELLADKYTVSTEARQTFSVSTQHYSFVVRAFANTVKFFGMTKFQFQILETKTRNVVNDVANGKSDIGILYESHYNKKYIAKLLRDNSLEFHPLIECRAWAYMTKNHPLAKKDKVSFDDLKNYPCIRFDQGDNGSSYLAEEILADMEFPQMIITNDRATNLNLMVALNAYTLCSGIISKELNGPDYVAIPFQEDARHKNETMAIGYIIKVGSVLNPIGEHFIEEIRSYLGINDKEKPSAGAEKKEA